MGALDINEKRLRERFDAMSAVGATPGGGVSRQTLTEADRQARDLLRRWMEQAGLHVRVDDMGTMYGRLEGRRPGAPAVALGSHLDSVHMGGRFDGALGVLAALEVVESAKDRGLALDHPLEVINFTNEEGSRFAPSMLASGVLAGAFSRDYAYSRTDVDGVTFLEALEAIGYRGREEDRLGPVKAYLELHVEQGPILDRRGIPIGVVEGIQGITWSRVTVRGQANHAGTTPMDARRDGLLAAARMMLAARDVARAAGEQARATTGAVEQVLPNVINAVAGTVRFTVDFRHPDGDELDRMAARFQEEVARIAREEGVAAEVERFWTSPPVRFDAGVVDAVEQAARELGLDTLRMPSGAGHDAGLMARIAPTGMIFVPSRDGKSHCEEEYTQWEHAVQGVRVLARTAYRLAGGAGDAHGA